MIASRPTTATAIAVLAVASLAGVLWFGPAKEKEKSSKAAPAAVVQTVKEEDLGKVVLTAQAEERLGIVLGEVARRNVERVRVYGGEVIVPVGHTVLVAAPLGGMLEAPETGVPTAGRRINKGDPIFVLRPLLSPEASTTFAASKVDAEGQAKNAQTQLDTAKLALERAERLYRQEAGSQRSVEEAKAQHDVALRSLEAAEARLAVLTKAVGDAAEGRASPLAITAPQAGMLRNVSALPGQNVPVSAALFEIVDLKEVWVRAAVPVGDREQIDASADAAIGNLNAQPGSQTWPARPVEAPPSANPLAATVDLYYALKNPDAEFTPGQRVGVTLSMQEGGESLTVPWGAILHDVNGGTWVYEQAGERKYKRRRVLVRYVAQGLAVLATGPSEGTRVVTEGALELFGAETGFSK
jgi:RND family efflux transporter MFP subunit